MMTMTQACFSQQQLRDYLLGRLGEQESEQLETHLQQCAACEETAAQLEADDTLVVHLRSVSEHAPPCQDERFAASAERVKQMGPSSDGMSSGSHDEADRSGSVDAAGPLGGYELLERIGRGGMGAVYRGRHRRLDRIVAIKLLPSRCADDAEAIARFQQEMRAVGRLDHPAIITATDAGEHCGTHFLVMELVDGLDLARIARAIGPLPIAEACELARQAALGLEYVHAQGVVHRDIKPSNLMLDRQGRVKILDLGLAQLGPWQQPVDEYTTVGQLMGTLDYMAPEQSESGQRTDYRSDLYSLGATLYRLLCGRAPYAVTPYLSPLEKLRLLASSAPPKLATLRPDAPPELCELVDQLLARDPTERPAGAAIVAQRLAPLCDTAALVPLLDQARQRLAEDPPEQQDADDQRVLAAAAALPAAAAGPAVGAEPAAGAERSRSGWKTPLVAAALLPLLLFAGLFIVLETSKGQIVIQSDAADVQVRLLRDGEPAEKLTIQHGANATRVRAGEYEVVIDQGSDALVISDNTFTLRRGETVVTRITRRGPAESGDALADAGIAQAPPVKAVAAGPTYEGKTLDEWLAMLPHERAPDEMKAAIEAIQALADRDSALRASETALRAVRQLSVATHPASRAGIQQQAFLLTRKLLEPEAAMRTVLEQLNLDDPQWRRHILSSLDQLIDLREYPGSLDPLVERVTALAMDREQPAVSSAALARLLELAVQQHRRDGSVKEASEALERALEASPTVESIFGEYVAEGSWPESLQRIFLRWSAQQLTADEVAEVVLMRALVNISVNVPLAIEMFPDLPQTIAAQLVEHTDPVPGDDDSVVLKPPFAKQAVQLVAEALRVSGQVGPPPAQFTEAIQKRGMRTLPAVILASLARHPALRTEVADQRLEIIARELASLERLVDTNRNWLGMIAASQGTLNQKGQFSPLALYLISRGAVEEAASEDTAPEQSTAPDAVRNPPTDSQ